MKKEVNGKTVNVNEKEVANLMESLDLSEDEAVNLWLEDNGYMESAEYTEALEKAKNFKVDHGTSGTKHKTHRTVKRKVSDEKKEVFAAIVAGLKDNGFEPNIEKENKLITLEVNGIKFKVDLIQQRPPKVNA